MNEISIHTARSGANIAYLSDGPAGGEASPTGLVWLGGFMSDMAGAKAAMLAGWAHRAGRPCLRFDYSGHGSSGGEFRDGTISAWLDEAVEMFLHHAPGSRVVVGSSMGGWLALLLLRRLVADAGKAAARLKGLVLIAPAGDMTEDLMWQKYSQQTRQRMQQDGFIAEPSEYGEESYVITRKLIEDGEQHLLLEAGLDVHCPVRILQGEADRDVPWEHGLKVYHSLRGEDISLSLIKGGDHRLSTPRDLKRLEDVCRNLCERADA